MKFDLTGKVTFSPPQPRSNACLKQLHSSKLQRSSLKKVIIQTFTLLSFSGCMIISAESVAGCIRKAATSCFCCFLHLKITTYGNLTYPVNNCALVAAQLVFGFEKWVSAVQCKEESSDLHPLHRSIAQHRSGQDISLVSQANINLNDSPVTGE